MLVSGCLLFNCVPVLKMEKAFFCESYQWLMELIAEKIVYSF